MVIFHLALAANVEEGNAPYDLALAATLARISHDAAAILG
jgi:hypothetical protein